jgi:hypothetical protein
MVKVIYLKHIIIAVIIEYVAKKTFGQATDVTLLAACFLLMLLAFAC